MADVDAEAVGVEVGKAVGGGAVLQDDDVAPLAEVGRGGRGGGEAGGAEGEAAGGGDRHGESAQWSSLPGMIMTGGGDYEQRHVTQ